MEIPDYIKPLKSYGDLPFDMTMPVTVAMGGAEDQQIVLPPPPEKDEPEGYRFGLHNHIIGSLLSGDGSNIVLTQNDVSLGMVVFMGQPVTFDASNREEIINKLNALLDAEFSRAEELIEEGKPPINVPDYITPIGKEYPVPFDLTKPVTVIIPQPEYEVTYIVQPVDPTKNEPLWYMIKLILMDGAVGYIKVEQDDIKYFAMILPTYGGAWADQKYSLEQIAADLQALN